MPRSFLVKSKRAHSYHQPRGLDQHHGGLEVILAHVCAGGFVWAQLRTEDGGMTYAIFLSYFLKENNTD